jgi:hypothetical protein
MWLINTVYSLEYRASLAFGADHHKRSGAAFGLRTVPKMVPKIGAKPIYLGKHRLQVKMEGFP